MKIAFLTLGCKVNSYETEQMKSRFQNAGYRIVAFSEQADIYLVNTCTVTNIADRKSRKMLHRARRMNPGALVVAAGCYVDSAKQKGEADDAVDLFLSNAEKDKVVERVEAVMKSKKAVQPELKDDMENAGVKRGAESAEAQQFSAADGRKHCSDNTGKQELNGNADLIRGWVSGKNIDLEQEAGRNVDMNRKQKSDSSMDPVQEENGKSAAAQAEERTRAYIQVQNGCNQYCSYCIIPHVRGALTSKPVSRVQEEVRQMAGQGFQEVVVTGIHLSSYGVESDDARAFVNAQGKPLLDLLEAMKEVGGKEGIRRIRLGSLEPRIITREFVKRLTENEFICPHFHLSLQSGCDSVLHRMNRHYTTAEYQEKVEILREMYEHPAITTDIIVGFPQETEEEFLQTRKFVEQIGFAQIHVFKYSRRQGTVADQMKGQISEQEKSIRSDILIQTQKRLTQQYQEYFLGRVAEVLFEEITEIGGKRYLIGYTDTYIRVAVAVSDLGEAERRQNTFGLVRITKYLDADVLYGEPVACL